MSCRTCDARVIWADQPNGRPLILDYDPSPNGNVRLRKGQAEVLGKDAAAEARLAGEELYISHFATCPQAAKWRKGAK